MLRLAACLEEHYPHSIANAVVEEAKVRGLSHNEYHSQVQYVVAHGISSMVNDKKVLIGSAHFVFEDEGCTIPVGEEDKYNSRLRNIHICSFASQAVLQRLSVYQTRLEKKLPTLLPRFTNAVSARWL